MVQNYNNLHYKLFIFGDTRFVLRVSFGKQQVGFITVNGIKLLNGIKVLLT